jgi:outer membrane protein assembly factor BamB
MTCARLLVASLCGVGLAAARSAPVSPLEGDWIGTVRGSVSQEAEIGFGFHAAPDGSTHLSFYMPSMHVYGADLGPIATDGGRVDFPGLDTRLSLEGDRLTGTFGKAALRVALRRGGKFSPGPPDETETRGPAPEWTRSLGAGAWGSPVASDGIVYLGTTDGKFHAVDARDGAEVWTWAGPNPIYGEALVVGGRVSFLDDHCDLVCLKRKDGGILWRVALHGAKAPADKSFNHRTAAPVEREGVVYVGSRDGAAYALDAGTGALRWRREVGSPVYARATIQGTGAWFACYSGASAALDLATGAETGRFTLPGPVVSAPVFADGVVLEGCRDYMLYGVRPADGSVAWRYSYWFSWVESAPALAGGVAYIGASDFSRITALRPATGEVVWSTDVHGMSWGTPLVAGVMVYSGTAGQRDALIRHRGSLVALDRDSGRIRWRVPARAPEGAPMTGYAGSPALAGPCVVAASVDGTVSAFRVPDEARPLRTPRPSGS